MQRSATKSRHISYSIRKSPHKVHKTVKLRPQSRPRFFSSASSRIFTASEITEGQNPVDLHVRFRKATNPTSKPPLIILHGLLGHSNNWSNISAKPSLHADRDILSVDLRNHGQSPHTVYHDYVAMANDIAALITQHTGGKGCTVVGHSMGGKVTAALALLHPHLVTGAVLVDILPVTYTHQMKEINTILHTVAGVDFSHGAGRKEVDVQLAKEIKEPGIRAWLLTNVVNLTEKDISTGAIMRWKPNVVGLLQNYAHIRDFELGTTVWPYHGPTMLILGGRSSFGDRNSALDVMGENFPECELGIIEGAGHWCHSEKPDDFTNQLVGFLNKHNL